MTTHRDVLLAVDAARAHTRRAKRAGWIPLAVFGVLVLPALAFHLQSRTVVTTFENGTTRPAHYPYANEDGGQGLLWYWQLAIPLGYLVAVAVYAYRNRRAGVRTATRAYLVTGIVLVIALFVFADSAVAPLQWANFGMHGMEATITIGLALFVLARLERSVALAVAAAVVTAVALAASQYDIANLWFELFDLQVPAWLGAATNDLALGAALLVCAALVAFVDRVRSRPIATT